MSSDREVQARRRQAILDILGEEPGQITEQQELVERLRARGIQATQSSISRDLKVLGAVRTRGYYEIPDWIGEEEEDASPVRKVIPFVRAVRQAGPYQLFIATSPGTGRAVAQAITEAKWEDVVGIVDGDSGVLLLTENFFFQRLLYARLRHYLSTDETYELKDLE